MEKRKQRLIKNMSRAAQQALDTVEQTPNCPRNLRYFSDILRSTFVDNNFAGLLLNHSTTSQPRPKVIGLYCVMVPEELIYAAGAIPVRLCGGSHGAAAIGEELAPRDACALVKSSLGQSALQTTNLYDLCDVIIVPTTCDGKRKMAEELARNHEVWMLEVPHLKESASARLLWLEQLYALKTKLESLTKQTIKRKMLQ